MKNHLDGLLPLTANITALYELNNRISQDPLIAFPTPHHSRSISIDPPPTDVGQMEFAFFVDES